MTATPSVSVRPNASVRAEEPTKPRLLVQIRTPEGLLCDREIRALSAEDEAGWFGIWPGREDVVACLPPGLLTFRDAREETFVALSGGLLELRGSLCRVMAREAKLSTSLDEVADDLAQARAARRARGARRSGVLADLEREALRRFAAGGRS